MRIKKTEENGLVELAVFGEIKFSNWEKLVQETLDILDEGPCVILMDWCEVTYFDSSALQGLVTIYNHIKNDKNKSVLLFTDKHSHMHLFEITSFTRLLPIFSSREEAIKNAVVTLSSA